MPVSIKKGLQELSYKAEWRTVTAELVNNQNLTTAFGESRLYTQPEWRIDSLSMNRNSKIHTKGELHYGTFKLSIDQKGLLVKIDSIIIE